MSPGTQMGPRADPMRWLRSPCPPLLDVEVGRWLVEHVHVGRLHHHHADGEALELPPRELVHVAVHHVPQVALPQDPVKQLALVLLPGWVIGRWRVWKRRGGKGEGVGLGQSVTPCDSVANAHRHAGAGADDSCYV
jgi:hypothetical protein